MRQRAWRNRLAFLRRLSRSFDSIEGEKAELHFGKPEPRPESRADRPSAHSRVTELLVEVVVGVVVEEAL